MKMLITNLKRLYQKPEMWAWYLLNGVFIFLIVLSLLNSANLENRPVGWYFFIMPFLNLCLIGTAMGRLAMDVWNKQMFFCLPRQNETSMTMISLVGLATSIAIYIVMLLIFSWDRVGLIGGSILLISYYLMIYLLSLIISILLRKLFFILPFFALFIPNISKYYGINYIFEKSFFDHMWLYTFSFFMISCIIYYSLKRKALIRFLVSGSEYKILFFIWSKVLFKSHNSPDLIKNSKILRFSELFDNFFYRKILLNNDSLILPNIWGRMYLIFRYLISNYQRIFSLCFLVFFCALLFINDKRMFDLQPYFFSLFGVLGGYMCLMSGSGILLPVGRKGQFFGGVTAVLTSTFLILVLGAAFVLLSHILSAVANSTSFIFFLRPEYISFHGKYIFLSLVILPITGGLLILFRNRLSLSIISIMILALLLLVINLHIINNDGHIFNISNLFIFILITVLSFIFYLATLYYDSIKRSIY